MLDADAFLFDLDETLVSSVDTWISVSATAASLHGVRLSRDDCDAILHTRFDRVLLNRGVRPEIVTLIMEDRDLLLPDCLRRNVRWKDGAEAALESLADHGRTAIVTNSHDIAFRAMDETLDLRSRVKLVLTWDDVGGRGKPDRYPLLRACEELDVDPARAVKIGDNMNDKLAADAAGTQFVLVRGVFTPESLVHHHTVSSLREIFAK